MIALIDYGAGNLTSVRKALAAVGADVDVPRAPSALARSQGIIVPGVGHFQATSALSQEWRDGIIGAVETGRPLFGICLGLQWLFEGSTEAPECEGLSLMTGECFRLGNTDVRSAGPEVRRAGPLDRPNAPVLKVPHVGWNALSFPRPSRLFSGVPEGSQVYFTHSYAAPVTGDTTAITTHGLPFASAVERSNVFGVQFHPEKSGDVGLRVLKNFLDAL